jgi:hypothetical protein
MSSRGHRMWTEAGQQGASARLRHSTHDGGELRNKHYGHADSQITPCRILDTIPTSADPRHNSTPLFPNMALSTTRCGLVNCLLTPVPLIWLRVLRSGATGR